MKKTFRVFEKKTWTGFLLFAIAVVLLHSALNFDFFSYETRIPDVEKISSVTLYAQADEAILTSPEAVAQVMQLHKDAVATKQENKTAKRHNWEDMGCDTQYFRVNYLLKNGRTLERRYNLCSTGTMLNVLQQVEDVMNGKEAVLSRVPDPEAFDPSRIKHAAISYSRAQSTGEPTPTVQGDYRVLTAAEAYELYTTCILPDMLEGTIGTVWFGESSRYFNPQYEGNIEIEVSRLPEGTSDEYGRTYSYYYFIPTEKSLRTNAWLQEHGIHMLLQDYVHSLYEQEKETEINLNPNSADGASSIGIIGGADGPTSIIVS